MATNTAEGFGINLAFRYTYIYNAASPTFSIVSEVTSHALFYLYTYATAAE